MMKKSLLVLASALALAACAPAKTETAAPAAASSAQAQSQTERNKANVLAFYDLAFNQHKVKEATEQYVGAEYLQHNPGVADGGQAFIDAFAPFLKEHPGSRAEVKRVAADGDLVWLHVHSQMDEKDRGEAVVDIFRLDENGKIVEHWDVIQAVPEKTVSGRGMF
ncbi:nuclear transport factor 2 family protein [Bergeriella denitrificans]|uniref:Predicted ester cyclase n=1 Tax=Bergeriella denitrificans TaxID=494 RepID=A0A378UKF4_BERDE|nr:nuclear transport factor 2 family protein [Bergeriella denitrificans]STZ76971.1 Predicted ester cyclase [Bergeriella denitrificans]